MKSGRRKTAPRRAGLPASPVFAVLLFLLFALPIFFTPGLFVDEFAFPKASLLVTGALLLAAWWTAAESSRVGSAGFPGWLKHVPGRMVTAVRRDPIGGAVGLFLLSAVASTVASPRPGLSLFGAQHSQAGLRTIVALAAIYFASRSLASKSIWIRRVAQAAAAGALVVALYTLLQISGFDPPTLTWHREVSFRSALVPGTLGHPYPIAAYLTMCLPLIAWLGACAVSRRTRIAWAALALLALLVAGACLSSGAVSSPGIAWRMGLKMAADHPVVGVGLDAYAAAFPRYRTPELARTEGGGTPLRAQSELPQILATQGILGGLAALAVVLLTARAIGMIVRGGSGDTRSAAIAVGVALLSYALIGIIGHVAVASGAMAAALAGWAARASRATDPGSVHEGPPVRSFWNLAAGVALAGAVWFLLVFKPLRAELYLSEAMRAEVSSMRRAELLTRAGETATWDPRYGSELGRSLLSGAMGAGDREASWTQLARAREVLERTVRLAPGNAENRVLLGTVLAAQAAFRPSPEAHREAREEFDRAVALDPHNPSVLVAAERGLLAAGLVEDARGVALRSVRAFPDYAPPLADLGAIALEEGRTAAAAETLQLAVARDWRGDFTSAANAWNDLARARLELGQFEETKAAADSALAYNPRLRQAFAIREAARRALGEHDEDAQADSVLQGN